MTEPRYRLVWVAKIVRNLPEGTFIYGDRLSSGEGSNPLEAMERLKQEVNDHFDNGVAMADQLPPDGAIA